MVNLFAASRLGAGGGGGLTCLLPFPSANDQEISMDPINVIITFEAKPERASAFAELMSQVKQSLPSAAGCRGVQLFGRSDNACVFTLVESWESQGHHQAHVAARWRRAPGVRWRRSWRVRLSVAIAKGVKAVRAGGSHRRVTVSSS
jgi:quinol monooxygenase YgiN